jgi:hypothetical protein
MRAPELAQFRLRRGELGLRLLRALAGRCRGAIGLVGAPRGVAHLSLETLDSSAEVAEPALAEGTGGGVRPAPLRAAGGAA